MARRALLVVNRLSRSGEADLTSAIGCLKAAGVEVLPFGIENPAEIPKLIRAHRCRIDMVVLGGGEAAEAAGTASPATKSTTRVNSNQTRFMARPPCS